MVARTLLSHGLGMFIINLALARRHRFPNALTERRAQSYSTLCIENPKTNTLQIICHFIQKNEYTSAHIC